MIADKLSIKSDEFALPPPEFSKFLKLAPLPSGTLRDPGSDKNSNN